MPAKYNRVTRLLHWLTALLVVATFALGPEDMDEMENPGLDSGVQIHETLGLIIFGLTVLRLVWVFLAQPRVDIPMPRLMSASAKAVQGVLYLLLLFVPFTAIFGTWLEGDTLALVQNVAIHSPVSINENLGERLLDLHPMLADILMWLAGAHAAAALFHHYVLKDAALKSMLFR